MPVEEKQTNSPVITASPAGPAALAGHRAPASASPAPPGAPGPAAPSAACGLCSAARRTTTRTRLLRPEVSARLASAISRSPTATGRRKRTAALPSTTLGWLTASMAAWSARPNTKPPCTRPAASAAISGPVGRPHPCRPRGGRRRVQRLAAQPAVELEMGPGLHWSARDYSGPGATERTPPAGPPGPPAAASSWRPTSPQLVAEPCCRSRPILTAVRSTEGDDG